MVVGGVGGAGGVRGRAGVVIAAVTAETPTAAPLRCSPAVCFAIRSWTPDTHTALLAGSRTLLLSTFFFAPGEAPTATAASAAAFSRVGE